MLGKSVDTRRTRRTTEVTEESNDTAVILSAAKDLAPAHQSQILRA